MYGGRVLNHTIKQNKIFLNNICGHGVNGSLIKILQKRNQTTVSVGESYVKRFMNAVGWMDKDKTRLKLTGYFVYENVPEKVAYEEWFRKLKLPDTFTSWFVVTELHVWILMVRYMAEKITSENVSKKHDNGHIVRNSIIEALWADVGSRIKLLEGANPVIVRKQVSELSEQFQAALVSYDEGLCDDRILAAAFWRRFYSLSSNTDAENIESIVHFTRHQMALLDKIPSQELKWKPKITWLSIENH